MRLSLRCALAMVLIGLVTVGASTASAQVVYDGFGPAFPAGGHGFAGDWQQGGFNVSDADLTVSGASLPYPRLRVSGGHISSPAMPVISGIIRDLAQPLGADNTTMYLSVLLRPEGTLHAGAFQGFFGVTLAGGPANELFFGKPGGGAIGEYVIEHRGGSGQVPSGVAAAVGETVLLVVRADFRPGNDAFTMYVNPVPGAPEPGFGVMKVDLDLGVVSRLGLYHTGAFAADEIRLGATFADVVPRAFAGTPGAPNCHGQSVAALAQEFGGFAHAARALGYSSVNALHQAILSYCAN